MQRLLMPNDMSRIKILIEGYAHPGKNGSYVASPSTVLIESKGKKVLVDPGANPNLLKVLKKENLTTKDIDVVYLTHYHIDHILNIRMFPKHVIYDGEIRWDKDKEFFYQERLPGTDIEILPTPGHSTEHTSLVVKNTDKGIVCIAADVFWWEDGKQKSNTAEDLIDLRDPFVTDAKALRKSREKILKIADWIIPGHGKIFKNPSKQLHV